MITRTFCAALVMLLTVGIGVAYAAQPAEGISLREHLVANIRAAVARSHEAMVQSKAAGKSRAAGAILGLSRRWCTYTKQRMIRRCSHAPWTQEEMAADTAPGLKKRRGDFFCAPFGDNTKPWCGEHHPAYGETAARPWSLAVINSTSPGVELIARLRAKVRSSEVTEHKEGRLMQWSISTAA